MRSEPKPYLESLATWTWDVTLVPDVVKQRQEDKNHHTFYRK